MQRSFRRVHTAVLEILRQEGWEAGTVLDVGCGTGLLLEKLARVRPEARMIGVDPAERMVEVARGKYGNSPRFRFEVGSAEQLPLPDESVDLVLSTVSAHHWPDLDAGLREIARVLRPGGHVLIADIHLRGNFRIIAPILRILRGEQLHSADDFRRAFESASLGVVYQRPLRDTRGWVLGTAGVKPGRERIGGASAPPTTTCSRGS